MSPARPTATALALVFALAVLALPASPGLAATASAALPPAADHEAVPPATDNAARPSTAPTPATDPNDSTDRPRIVAVVPNPVAAGDAGEFVVVSFPRRTNLSGWALADGERRVPLVGTAGGTRSADVDGSRNASDGDATVVGRVAFAADAERVRTLTDVPVRSLPRRLGLANAGERLVLLAGDRTVHAVTYRDAPEGEVFRVTDRTWRPLGATDRRVVHAGPTRATAFVLPDAPGVPVRILRGADERILLAGYTLTSHRVRDALLAAHRRGVGVRVLVEGSPVGGFPRRGARVLEALSRAGVDVRVLGGPYDRYAFHHAKYAVVDDRALVLTENWKPAGTGGNSSRGWGVVLDSPRAARALAATFAADAGWRDARPWRRVRDRRLVADPPANGTYPTTIAPERLRVRNATVLVAPDNAERALVARLRAAESSIRIVQVSIDGPEGAFLRATLAAAGRGVRVRILLSSAWYVREDNRRLVAWLNERAARRDLDLEARLVDTRGRFEKVHAKGIVVDDAAVVGSLNWNDDAARANREVVVVLEGRAAADYYGGVFDADWRASGETNPAGLLPVGVLVALALGAVAALAVARRVRFADRGT